MQYHYLWKGQAIDAHTVLSEMEYAAQGFDMAN